MGQELPISQQLSRNTELKYSLRMGKKSNQRSCHCSLTWKSDVTSLLGVLKEVFNPGRERKGPSHASLLLAFAGVAFPHKLSLLPYVVEAFACVSVPYTGTPAHQEL